MADRLLELGIRTRSLYKMPNLQDFVTIAKCLMGSFTSSDELLAKQ